jgi:Fe-S cluster assembly protein SufD
VSTAAPFVEAFRAFEAGLNGETRAPAHALRRRGIAAFEKSGFPTTKLEAWRHTNVASLVAQPLAWQDRPGTVLERSRVASLGLAADAPRLVLVDGVLSRELSDLDRLGNGVTVDAIGAGASELTLIDTDGFVALNTAFLRHGVTVRVAAGATVGPLHLVWVSTGGANVRHPRALFAAAEGSTCTLFESWVGLGERDYLVNAVTEIDLAARASLTLVRLVAESGAHIGATEVRCAAESRFNGQTVCAGGSLVRESLFVRLLGEGADARLRGLYLGRGKEHVDNTTVVEHAVPRCTSNEYYKGIVAGSSSSVFYGKVIVRLDAQKSDATQQNKNLVLSKQASANTRPQLEIYADDVKCAHGATVGQLDAAQLFYLRSRGIGAEEARRLLTYAFASEIVNDLTPSVRERVAAIVRGQLEE